MSAIPEEDIEIGNDINQTSVNCFPQEVLIHTFALLPLEDRKNVKRVSRRWYDCCRCFSIAKNEKFVFRGDASIPDIVDILMPVNIRGRDDKNWRIRIEFQDVSVHSLPSKMWKVCGHRIDSLEFRQCRLDGRTVTDLIAYCVNLERLEIDLSRTAHENSIEFTTSLSQRLYDFSCEDVERTKLRTLSLLFDHSVPQDLYAYVSLLSIYPCVQNFSVGVAYSCRTLPAVVAQYVHNTVMLEDVNVKIHSALNNWCEQLNKLTFNFPSVGEWMGKYLQPLHGLNKLETMLLYNVCTAEGIIDFFLAQKNLTVVKLVFVKYESDVLILMLIFLILNNCPHLRELHIEFDNLDSILSFEWDEFARFLSSILKLRHLTLNFTVLNEPSAAICEQIHAISSTGYALTTLNLRNVEDKFCDTFLKYCTELKHLKLGNESTDYILQTIFEHLSNLRTLILTDLELCTDGGMSGLDEDGNRSGFSIKRLEKLRHLGLYDHAEEGTSITAKIVFELQFPYLKFLGLGFLLYDKLSIEVLINLASNLPALEVLAIDEITNAGRISSKTLKFCVHLKKLTRLIYCHLFKSSKYLKKLYYKDEQGIQGLFQACPNLRYISDSEQTTILRNTRTSKVCVSNVKFQDSVFENFW